MATKSLSKKATPAPASAPAAPAQAAGEVLRYGTYEFELMHDDVLPEDLKVRTRPTQAYELPFKGWFDKMSHAKSFFIPNTFWVDRGKELGVPVELDKVNSTYVRNKVRGQFNQWKFDRVEDPDAAPVADKEGKLTQPTKLVPKPGRENHDILFAYREQGMGHYQGQPGYQVYMKVTPAKE